MVRCEPWNRTFFARDVGVSPSPASMTPAFTSSSLNFIIFAMSSSLGILPASLSRSAGTNTITRMCRSFGNCFRLNCSGGAALRPDAGVEHRSHLRLALEPGPVLAVQLHELGRDADRVRLRLRV